MRCGRITPAREKKALTKQHDREEEVVGPERDDIVQKKVLALARQGRLPCAAALQLAAALGVSPRVVGEAADAAGVKITACQLGCFGTDKERKQHGIL